MSLDFDDDFDDEFESELEMALKLEYEKRRRMQQSQVSAQRPVMPPQMPVQRPVMPPQMPEQRPVMPPQMPVQRPVAQQQKQTQRPAAQQQSKAIETADIDETDSSYLSLPVRIGLSLILFAVGAMGVFFSTTDSSLAGIPEIVCLTEAVVCFMTAICINAETIPNRKNKEKIVRTALMILLGLYCLKIASTLFLGEFFTIGMVQSIEIGEFAAENVKFSFEDGLDGIDLGLFMSTLLYLAPLEFCLPILFRSCRNFAIYLLSCILIFSVIAVMRLITLSGGFALMQIIIALMGAVAMYLIFSFDSMQNLLRNVGLLEWADLDDEDDE